MEAGHVDEMNEDLVMRERRVVVCCAGRSRDSSGLTTLPLTMTKWEGMRRTTAHALFRCEEVVVHFHIWNEGLVAGSLINIFFALASPCACRRHLSLSTGTLADITNFFWKIIFKERGGKCHIIQNYITSTVVLLELPCISCSRILLDITTIGFMQSFGTPS